MSGWSGGICVTMIYLVLFVLISGSITPCEMITMGNTPEQNKKEILIIPGFRDSLSSQLVMVGQRLSLMLLFLVRC